MVEKSTLSDTKVALLVILGIAYCCFLHNSKDFQAYLAKTQEPLTFLKNNKKTLPNHRNPKKYLVSWLAGKPASQD